MKPGRYKAFVVDKLITENSKGNPQVVIQLEVDVDGVEKRTMNYYGQLTDGATEHTLKALVACGITDNDLTAPVTKGKEVSVVVDADTDKDGNPRMKISWINKPMGLGTPMDEIKAKSVLNKYSGMLAKLRASEVPNLAPKKASGDGNDPIPF